MIELLPPIAINHAAIAALGPLPDFLDRRKTKEQPKMSSVKYHPDLVQGSEEWLAARCGLLTASEMKLVITPTLKIANNDKERAHLYELLAQRVTQYVEPTYVGDAMIRGMDDEIEARTLYNDTFAPVENVGFITNSRWGFTIGYSPDGVVGEDGLIECKSRRQKYQIETIIGGKVPDDFLIQVQTGLLVSERKWLDFLSYCGGLPMFKIRVYPDNRIQEAILEAAVAFEARIQANLEIYHLATNGRTDLIPTERKVIMEMYQ